MRCCRLARSSVWLAGAAVALSSCAAAGGPGRHLAAGSGTGPPAAGVVGRVVTASGRPVGGALIVPRPLDAPPQPVPEIAVLSGADGQFAWPLPPGRYRLAALLAGQEIAAGAATVAPGRSASVELTAGR